MTLEECLASTCLKCAYTLFPMTCISAGQELTCIRQELASCWPWGSMGMRSGGAPSFLTPRHLSKLPSELPHRHIIISEPFITLPDLVKKCLKYLKSCQGVIQDKQMKHFSSETRLKTLLLSPRLQQQQILAPTSISNYSRSDCWQE